MQHRNAEIDAINKNIMCEATRRFQMAALPPIPNAILSDSEQKEHKEPPTSIGQSASVIAREVIIEMQNIRNGAPPEARDEHNPSLPVVISPKANIWQGLRSGF